MDLLREVPGINFGPDIVTWPALVSAFADSSEAFTYGDMLYPMSALTLASSELGNLINPYDKDMMNLYITLWDSRKKLDKRTKMSGCDAVESPWINMIGCTTPHWISDNMNQAALGGGFISRCIFVYADKKENFVAYGDEAVAHDYEEHRQELIHDLEHIAVNLTGPYKLTDAARAWGRQWYEELWSTKVKMMDNETLEGYVSRKQTHIHKLSMVLAASRSDEMVIDVEDLQLADLKTTELEEHIPKVFARIGQSDVSVQAERFISYVQRHGEVTYKDAYRFIHNYFPDAKDLEGIVAGAIRAGYMNLIQKGDTMYLIATKEK